MNPKPKLLLVEDERMLAEILSDTLKDRDFEVRTVFDGLEALDLARLWQPDLLLLDVMMPRMDGFTLARHLRREGCRAPILFLTARSSTEDVVKGFESGGNDYLRKPFALDELIVRVRALLARFAPPSEGQELLFEIGNYRFRPATAQLEFEGGVELLPTREAEVLERLCRQTGEIVHLSPLLRELWGDDTFFNLRSLNVFISRLRRRLGRDPRIRILSIRGVGYKLIVRS